MFRHLTAKILDRVGYLWTLARLSIFDCFAGLSPETPADRALREEAGGLRNAFPHVDFDDPNRHVR